MANMKVANNLSKTAAQYNYVKTKLEGETDSVVACRRAETSKFEGRFYGDYYYYC